MSLKFIETETNGVKPQGWARVKPLLVRRPRDRNVGRDQPKPPNGSANLHPVDTLGMPPLYPGRDTPFRKPSRHAMVTSTLFFYTTQPQRPVVGRYQGRELSLVPAEPPRIFSDGVDLILAPVATQRTRPYSPMAREHDSATNPVRFDPSLSSRR